MPISPNYYTFTHYARYWLHSTETGYKKYEVGTRFEDVCEIIDRDQRLRLLLLEQISYIELALRSRFAYALAKKYGNGSFYVQKEYYNSSVLNMSGTDITELLHGDLKRKIIDGDIPPIGEAIEVFSFGKVSKMMRCFADEGPIREVTNELGIQWATFSSTVHAIVTLRNMCAHHNPLWNRPQNIVAPVKKKLRPRNLNISDKSVYRTIIMLNEYRKAIDGDESLGKQIIDFIGENERYANGIYHPLNYYGTTSR